MTNTIIEDNDTENSGFKVRKIEKKISKDTTIDTLTNIRDLNASDFSDKIEELFEPLVMKPIDKDKLLEEIMDTTFYHSRAIHLRGEIKERLIKETTELEKVRTGEYTTHHSLLLAAGERVTEARMERIVSNSNLVKRVQEDFDIIKGLEARASGLVEALLLRHSALKHMSEYMKDESKWGEYG